jgi:hypothetical protein
MHTGLFHAADHQHPYRRLNVTRANVKTLPPQLAVTHVGLAGLKVAQVSARRLVGRQAGLGVFPEALDGAGGAVAVKQPAAMAVSASAGSGVRQQGRNAVVQVAAGVVEAVGEDGAREGVAEGVFERGFAIGHAVQARDRAGCD